MYNDELQPIQVALSDLLLDPNNPRFWTKRNMRDIADSRIPDPKVQEEAQKRIEGFGIQELYHSFLRNGFLPLDRIVVRPVQGHGGKYVAVEGNRRLAALKFLQNSIESSVITEEGITDEYLEELGKSISTIEVLLYQGTDAHEISWIFQGIRHISGIRDWEPAQRAQLVTHQIDIENMSFGQAGQKFGLTAVAVGRLYRAYKGLEQMRSDDDYGAKARNDYFSLFEEAYRNRKVRDWLGWKEETKRFENSDNLKQFYSWIVPNEESDNKRRIHDPKHVPILALLLERDRQDLMGQIDRHEVTIEEAKGRTEEAGSRAYNWRNELEKAQQCVGNLPIRAFEENADELMQELEKLLTLVQNTINRYSS
jgi:hypothetical protein